MTLLILFYTYILSELKDKNDMVEEHIYDISRDGFYGQDKCFLGPGIYMI